MADDTKVLMNDMLDDDDDGVMSDATMQDDVVLVMEDDTEEHDPMELDLDGDTDNDGLVDDGEEDIGGENMDLDKDDNALDMQHRMGLYTEVDEENPQPLNLAKELDEQSRERFPDTKDNE